MIDVEQDIFKEVLSAVRKKHPGTYFTNEYVRTPPRFPCGYIEQKDSRNVVQTQDSASNENNDFLMYEVGTYSNRQNGKKAEAKEIMQTISDTMTGLGFTRTMLQPVPNMDDATIYRLTARFTSVVDQNSNIYGR